MWLAEKLLFALAKGLYRSEVAHSTAMKEALSDREKCNTYRSGQSDVIFAAAQKYGIDVTGKDVLDLGCNDGAITPHYVARGAARAIGIDVDADAVHRAQERHTSTTVSFHLGTVESVPLPDDSVDLIFCYDVFEHVSRPAAMLGECRRVLRPGGQMLIGTWGWYHPFAPHLWATMPVPWAHVFFSERTILRVCRRVYEAPWYVPNMHDLDEHGNKRKDRYLDEEISRDYLNKLLIRDFERVFADSKFDFTIFSQPFGSRYARWTGHFLKVPWLREFITSYIWVVLKKRAG